MRDIGYIHTRRFIYPEAEGREVYEHSRVCISHVTHIPIVYLFCNILYYISHIPHIYIYTCVLWHYEMEYKELELNKQTNQTNIVLLYFVSNTYILFMHLMTCHAKYGIWKWHVTLVKCTRSTNQQDCWSSISMHAWFGQGCPFQLWW